MSRPTTPLPQPPTQPSTASFASPPRSSTHPVKPRHHIPHHPHRTHHHRHHDVSVPQSAVQPTTSNPFGDVIPRTTAKVIDASKLPSLEQQQQQQQQQPQTEPSKEQTAKDEADREQAKWDEVEKKRTKRKAVDDDLLHTLSHLSTLSTTTTRRLDYTYYSLLSSISSLHSTLTSLHKLSLSLSTFSTTFLSETNSLTTELSSQISTTNTIFETQAARILDLEERIRKGREGKENLNGRLDRVRERVEGVVRRDVEGERRVGRRMRWLWGFLGGWVVLGLVVAILRGRIGGEGTDERAVELGRQLVGYSEVMFGGEGVDGRGNGSLEAAVNVSLKGAKDIPWDGEAGQQLGRASTNRVTTSAAPRGSSVDAEATLRLFDEL